MEEPDFFRAGLFFLISGLVTVALHEGFGPNQRREAIFEDAREVGRGDSLVACVPNSVDLLFNHRRSVLWLGDGDVAWSSAAPRL